LVAVEAGQVIGHILFSELPIQTVDGVVAAVSLAPMAVRPEWQRRGVGSALVREGLRKCFERGKAAAIVLGHPTYYRRLGFSSALALHLESPFSNAGEAWMAAELRPGALANVAGVVTYPAAFGLVKH
jgi:putative acetyltransferase